MSPGPRRQTRMRLFASQPCQLDSQRLLADLPTPLGLVMIRMAYIRPIRKYICAGWRHSRLILFRFSTTLFPLLLNFASRIGKSTASLLLPFCHSTSPRNASTSLYCNQCCCTFLGRHRSRWACSLRGMPVCCFHHSRLWACRASDLRGLPICVLEFASPAVVLVTPWYVRTC